MFLGGLYVYVSFKLGVSVCAMGENMGKGARERVLIISYLFNLRIKIPKANLVTTLFCLYF